MINYIKWRSQSCQGEPVLLALDADKGYGMAKLSERSRE
jgi:hypothetical protein